jgi:antagonist of KipI
MFTTVQDLGRAGMQRDGVPVSGAMDAFALRVANLLVGNRQDAAGLEITLAGPTLSFDRDAVVALCGAPLEARVQDRELPLWRAVWIPSGAQLACGGISSGCRTYLAVAGGIDEPLVLGGRSTFTRGRFGGHEGRALLAGDVLSLGAHTPLAMRIASTLAGDGHGVAFAGWGIGPSMRPAYAHAPMVRLLAGTHTTELTDEARAQLFGDTFRISPNSDRMGYRLMGPGLQLTRPLDLLSEAVAFGTMQLPPSGEPIVLMADRQTTGGYPRIGEVATVDLPLLAQLRPGDEVRFRPASLSEAQRLYLEREQDVQRAEREIAMRHR